MPVNDLLLKPNLHASIFIHVLSLVGVFFVAYLHVIVGPLYEFHLFFLIPVILAAWFTGLAFSCLVLMLVIILWSVGDFVIAEGKVDVYAFSFNAVMRVLTILYITYLLRYIHHLLLREFQLAREDGLTKIPNRRAFYDAGESIFSAANRHQLPITVIFIDVDNFKTINDTCGHKVGDELLVAVARVIRESVRKTDIVGRLGGDEFGIILLDAPGKYAVEYANHLRKKLNEVMSENNWVSSVSIGIVSYDLAPCDFLAALEKADTLMYKVKSTGRNNFLHECY